MGPAWPNRPRRKRRARWLAYDAVGFMASERCAQPGVWRYQVTWSRPKLARPKGSELGRLYRQARRGDVPVTDASRLATILAVMRQCLEASELPEAVLERMVANGEIAEHQRGDVVLLKRVMLSPSGKWARMAALA